METERGGEVKENLKRMGQETESKHRVQDVRGDTCHSGRATTVCCHTGTSNVPFLGAWLPARTSAAHASYPQMLRRKWRRQTALPFPMEGAPCAGPPTVFYANDGSRRSGNRVSSCVPPNVREAGPAHRRRLRRVCAAQREDAPRPVPPPCL